MEANLHNNQPQLPSQPPVPVAEFKQIEELKQVTEERRFVVSNYMQALALYITLSGFGLNKLSEPDQVLPHVWLMGCLFTLLNALAIYAAGRFKSMWSHADERERELTMQLQMKGPHSLIWGYWSGIAVVVISQSTVLVLVLLRQFGPIQFSQTQLH